MGRSVILKSWKMCASCTIDDSVTCKEHSKEILEFTRLMVNPVKFYLRSVRSEPSCLCDSSVCTLLSFRGALVCL